MIVSDFDELISQQSYGFTIELERIYKWRKPWRATVLDENRHRLWQAYFASRLKAQAAARLQCYALDADRLMVLARGGKISGPGLSNNQPKDESTVGEEPHKTMMPFGWTSFPRTSAFVPFGARYGDAAPSLNPTIDEPNAYVSLVTEGPHRGEHLFMIDIDMPCELVPSRTPGHFHLYVDKYIEREKYFRLLDMLADCGIVEQGYADASKRHGMTVLRLPGVEHEYEKIRRKLAATGEV